MHASNLPRWMVSDNSYDEQYEITTTQSDMCDSVNVQDGDDMTFNAQLLIDEVVGATDIRDEKIVEGHCIMFILKKIIFKRRPAYSFDNYIKTSLASSPVFQGEIHTNNQTKSIMNFEFFTNAIQERNISMTEVTHNLIDVYDELRLRTNDDIYIATCSLNEKYGHKSNKFASKNPVVKNHCVLFRRGNIVCAYLENTKLSLTKHLKITKPYFGLDNTSECSYISDITSIFRIIYSN
jgi:hypothetical protein